MNAASQWRYQLAQSIAPIYAANPQAAAVILGGSTARGHADRHSDIELGVFWRQPPSDADRQAAARAIAAADQRLYPLYEPEQVWSDEFFFGRADPGRPNSGLLLEVVHYTVDHYESILQAVLEQFDPDPIKQNLIAGVLDGLVLHNPQLIHQWQTRAADYPDELVAAVVHQHAQIDHFWRWEMWLARGNLLMLHQQWAQIQQQLLHVLLGLNRVYYFGFKWLAEIDRRLQHKPWQLLPRLQQVYQLAPPESAGVLASLVGETYDLIEAHLPDIDVDRLRTVFRYQRSAWDQPPDNALPNV